MTARQAKVLIVDDHPAVREALSLRISQQKDMRVCGEAADIADALERIDADCPDVAVIDISLRSGNGLELIKRIKARNREVRMLVWSMFAESLYAERALQAGAMGYLDKEHATDEIVSAIRRILEGKLCVSADTGNRLMMRGAGRKAPVENSPAETLSDRELQVFQMIGEGLKTREIAERLHLSVHTVETHRQRIKAKLAISSSGILSREATRWIMENR